LFILGAHEKSWNRFAGNCTPKESGPNAFRAESQISNAVIVDENPTTFTSFSPAFLPAANHIHFGDIFSSLGIHIPGFGAFHLPGRFPDRSQRTLAVRGENV